MCQGTYADSVLSIRLAVCPRDQTPVWQVFSPAEPRVRPQVSVSTWGGLILDCRAVLALLRRLVGTLGLCSLHAGGIWLSLSRHNAN